MLFLGIFDKQKLFLWDDITIISNFLQYVTDTIKSDSGEKVNSPGSDIMHHYNQKVYIYLIVWRLC